jgi:hypothetical protein
MGVRADILVRVCVLGPGPPSDCSTLFIPHRLSLKPPQLRPLFDRTGHEISEGYVTVQ